MLDTYQRFPLDLRYTTKEEIIDYFTTTYELFEKLFEIFTDDTIYFKQPEPLRHPLIFYYGHTATFYINKLIAGRLIDHRINPHYESLFAIGVDEMSWDDLNHDHYDWPSVKEVKAYRQSVKQCVIEYIKTTPLTLPINWDSPLWPIIMGIEHENIHLETSSVLHRQLNVKDVIPNSFGTECTTIGKHPTNVLLDVPEYKIELGLPHNHHYYGWDNEYGSYKETVHTFKASQYLTSNGEFLEFVNDNGYDNNEYWCKEGQAWKTYKKVKHPIFWIQKDCTYYYRTLTNCIELPLNWPVEVNYLEAQAFCRWKSKQMGISVTLPTEAMWHALIKHINFDNKSVYNKQPHANTHLAYYTSSCPVTQFQMGDFFDVIGNVWQWTQTPIEPFTGFKVHPLYDDFSVPTFDQKHNIIKGGSWASRGNVASIDSRYAFRRHFPQHAGFRYVQQQQYHQQTHATSSQNYQDDHKTDYEKAANIALEYPFLQRKKALNLGCYLGTATFTLAKYFEEVIGLDLSARHILQAQTLKENQTINNCEFWQGDSCNLKPHFTAFDLILITNDFDEFYDHIQLIDILKCRLNQNGAIILYNIHNRKVDHLTRLLNHTFVRINEHTWKKHDEF